MALNARYTAAQKREARAARQAAFEARNARWGTLSFEEFAEEYIGGGWERAIPEMIDDARAYWERCKTGEIAA